MLEDCILLIFFLSIPQKDFKSSLNTMKVNFSNPATGAQKLIDFEDERKT